MSRFSKFVAGARKALTALVAAAVTVAPLVADGEVSSADKWAIALAVLIPLGVYVVPNKPAPPTP